MSAGQRLTALLLVATTMAAAGCSEGSSGDADPTPSLTLAQTPLPSNAGPRADFLLAPEEVVLATTPAKDDSSYSGATFTFLRVETTARSTIVVWSATHPRTLSAGSDFDVALWGNFPVLSTKTQAFSVLTYETPTGETECVCVDMRSMRATPNPQGAIYPPLPEGTTSVILTSPWFEDITVPVTRS